MWLLLAFPDDAAAHWAARGLARRGLTPLVAVSPDAIVCSRDLVHEIVDGRPRTTFTLPDGRAIDSVNVRGALNRVTALPTAHLACAVADDRSYAEHELHAVVLSLLYGLGDRVINRPTPQGLAGRQRSEAEWIALAARAGFHTAAYAEDDREGMSPSAPPRGRGVRMIVLDDRVYGGACASAIALARLAETRLLGVDAIESPSGQWWFAATSTAPDLRVGGEALLDSLAAALAGTVAGKRSHSRDKVHA